jgi:hypothetical protein
MKILTLIKTLKGKRHGVEKDESPFVTMMTRMMMMMTVMNCISKRIHSNPHSPAHLPAFHHHLEKVMTNTAWIMMVSSVLRSNHAQIQPVPSSLQQGTKKWNHHRQKL